MTEFRRDQGQENQDRHLPSSKVEDALLSHDGFARRSGRYRGRDERGSQDPRIEKDHQGFDAGGNIGLIGLARRPQQIELLPYARQRRHEFAPRLPSLCGSQPISHDKRERWSSRRW